MNQAFYFIESINLDGLDIESATIRAYNGNVLVGEREWNGSYTDVPAMGYDGRIETAGYCEDGDAVELRILVDGIEYGLNGDLPLWSNNEIFTVYNLSVSSEESVPSELSLIGSFPNPFNPSTVIAYQLYIDGDVNISVYNMKGQLVSNLYDSYQAAGYHEITFDASDLSSGMYFVTISNGNEVYNQKVLLMK